MKPWEELSLAARNIREQKCQTAPPQFPAAPAAAQLLHDDFLANLFEALAMIWSQPTVHSAFPSAVTVRRNALAYARHINAMSGGGKG